MKETRIRFHILTLFPEAFSSVLSSSLLGKALQNGLIEIHLVQLRDFAKDKHRTVDDTPYGGGEGMLLKVDVLYEAWCSVAGGVVAQIQERNAKVDSADTKAPNSALTLLLSPQGPLFTQGQAKDLASHPEIILVCGHYEGVDERFIKLCVDREVSIGDFVLTGGELPAMVLVDAISRLVPGVVGDARSVSSDSLEAGLLKYPQYTRPREFMGATVPDVLLSGDHGAIARWRDDERVRRTRMKRPDLAAVDRTTK